MKKTGWMILLAALLTVGASAQDTPAASGNVIETENAYTFPIERLKAPTYADENCAGFINKIGRAHV